MGLAFGEEKNIGITGELVLEELLLVASRLKVS